MIVALDPVSGKLLWSLPFTTPYEQNSITPIQSGELLIFAGLQQPTFAIRPEKSGDTWKATRAWEMRDANFYMSTPVLVNGKLYGMSNKGRGTPVTIDAATGKLLWSGDGRLGDNASLLSAGGALLVLPTDGELRVLRPEGDSLAGVTRYTVADSPTWATPAVDKNHILVKDLTSLTLWDLPAATQGR
jgi:outer membrane protein assembly factor BamB